MSRRTTAGDSCSTSSTSCRETAPKSYPEVRTVSFRRDRADAGAAAALHIVPSDKVIRIRNVLSLGGAPVIVDDITLPAELFPGLSEKIFVARDNTIYHLYQSRYGINVLRTDERLARRAAPSGTWRRPWACPSARRSSRSAAWRSRSASGPWSFASRA